MTLAPRLYRTSNLTAAPQTTIICGLQREFRMLGDCRVKRCLNTHFRQSHGFCLGSSGLETAGMRYWALGNTAVLPRGDL